MSKVLSRMLITSGRSEGSHNSYGDGGPEGCSPGNSCEQRPMALRGETSTSSTRGFDGFCWKKKMWVNVANVMIRLSFFKI